MKFEERTTDQETGFIYYAGFDTESSDWRPIDEVCNALARKFMADYPELSESRALEIAGRICRQGFQRCGRTVKL